MENSRIDPLVLLAAFIAGLLALGSTHGYLSMLAGVTLLLVLFGYEGRVARSGSQSLAFAAVGGLGCVSALSPLILSLTNYLGGFPPSTSEYLPIILWLLATLVLWAVDRSTLNSRQAPGLHLAPASQAMAVPRPVFVAPAAPPPAPPSAAYSAPPPAPIPAPVPYEFQPRAAIQNAVPDATQFGLEVPVIPVAPPPVPQPAPPPPVSLPPRSGKEVTIYVNLIGEGMNMLRTVRAESLGRDFYLIVEEMPPGETWEFQTGQVVRCRKKNLSSGKGLVAYEEAPKAQ